MPETQQCQIWAMAVTYTTAHGNARFLTHWARPGIEPVSSWTLVRHLQRATTGTLRPTLANWDGDLAVYSTPLRLPKQARRRFCKNQFSLIVLCYKANTTWGLVVNMAPAHDEQPILAHHLEDAKRLFLKGKIPACQRKHNLAPKYCVTPLKMVTKLNKAFNS